MNNLPLFNQGRCLAVNGDCRETIQSLIDRGLYVDSIVTDPPYELGFMSKSWDKTGIANDVELWKLALLVLKPGGHLLAFGATRTYHRMACAIEDAGFEIRDSVHWLYGQGFPKSLNISKSLDKMAGVDPIDSGVPSGRHNSYSSGSGNTIGFQSGIPNVTAPATDAAKQWDGWGSALKPAHEPCVLARKPLSEKTIAENVLKHGTGGINVDGCRIEHSGNISGPKIERASKTKGIYGTFQSQEGEVSWAPSQGRFPSNCIHDGSDVVMEEFAKYGESGSSWRANKGLQGKTPFCNIDGSGRAKGTDGARGVKDTGSAARFFYSAKASAKDRNGSKHPTVKPLALMRYLCRLITPPGGIILDMFAGSGTTGQAALEEGFNAVLIEKETEYFEDIMRRIGA